MAITTSNSLTVNPRWRREVPVTDDPVTDDMGSPDPANQTVSFPTIVANRALVGIDPDAIPPQWAPGKVPSEILCDEAGKFKRAASIRHDHSH
jgi:hypothetical protein